MSLEERVRDELLMLRKSASGVTVGALSECPVITGLLGDGNPALAYNKLKHRTLSSKADLALKAVTASLGFTSDKPTHLGRLDDFGAEHNYDQRQARRYSDRGVNQLAKLITQSWSPEPSPCLDVFGYQTGSDGFAFMVETRRPHFVQMQHVEATLYIGPDEPQDLVVSVAEFQDGALAAARLVAPLELFCQEETSVSWCWRGELYPKFSLSWRTPLYGFGVTWESLGNRGMVRLLPEKRAT